MNYLKLMLANQTRLPIFKSFKQMHEEIGSDLPLEEFKADMISYMKKKKVSNFTVTDDILMISSFARLKIKEQLNYFKIGKDISAIDIRILFASWNEDGDMYNYKREFENYMINSGHKDDYFLESNLLVSNKDFISKPNILE